MTGPFDLEYVLAEAARPGDCRAYLSVSTGAMNRTCQLADEDAIVVTVSCEHEHVYDVSLCRAHLEAMPGAGIGCPTCRHAADDPLHKCRHGVLSGAS